MLNKELLSHFIVQNVPLCTCGEGVVSNLVLHGLGCRIGHLCFHEPSYYILQRYLRTNEFQYIENVPKNHHSQVELHILPFSTMFGICSSLILDDRDKHYHDISK